MRKWLENLSSQLEDKKLSQTEVIKRAVYLVRIQKRLDRELENLYWLCKNHPDVFLHGYKEDSPNSHMRLKKLLLCIKALNPKCDVELVLKNLKDEPKEEPKKIIKLFNGEEYQLKNEEIHVPYSKTVTLEGLNLVKEETISVKLEPLNLSKKETIQLPFKTKVKVKPDALQKS